MEPIKYSIEIEDVDVNYHFDNNNIIIIDRIPNIGESILVNGNNLYTITNIIYDQISDKSYVPSKIIVKWEFNMKKEIWKVGKHPGCVITNNSEEFNDKTGHLDPSKEYYGGTLICESIWRKKDAKLISAAPDLLRALEEALKYDINMPNHVRKQCKKACNKALGKKKYNPLYNGR